MERLTKLKGNYVCWNGNQDYSTRDRYAKVLDRLAAYEDTGLTPEEIKALTADKDQQAKLLEEAREEIQNCYGRDTDLTSKIDALLGGAEG